VLEVTADANIYISALNFGGKPLQCLELVPELGLPVDDWRATQ